MSSETQRLADICDRRWLLIHYLARYLPLYDPQWQAVQDELDSGASPLIDTDDTDGPPVGWTIEAIGKDGSIRCRSPVGHVRRYNFCAFNGECTK